MWKEEDHPRGQPDNKGQFAEKNSLSKMEEVVNVYSDDPVSDKKAMQEMGQIPRKKRVVDLPKKEYAELCSAVRTNYADKIPANGQVLYGNNYYQFRYNRRQERIVCTFKIKIESNEKAINYYWGIFDDE